MEAITLERTLTELDHVRLLNLLRRAAGGAGPGPALHSLAEILDLALCVPAAEVPPDIVTMRSQVLLQDMHTRQQSRLTLCYPADAAPAAGRVSVLSPVGSALLGLRAGSLARWCGPGGGSQAAEILDILFQPEASGEHGM